MTGPRARFVGIREAKHERGLLFGIAVVGASAAASSSIAAEGTGCAGPSRESEAASPVVAKRSGRYRCVVTIATSAMMAPIRLGNK